MRTKQFYRSRRDRGFTLIEIMVVIVIIGLIAAMVVPNIIGQLGQATVTTARQEMKSIKSGLDLYRMQNNTYPSTSLGIEALVVNPGESEAPRWTGPYLDNVPLDPWDREYVYQSPAGNSDRPYDLITLGADGREGGEGEAADISVWDIR